MNAPSVRNLVYCQVSFFSMLVIQIALRPESLTNNGGISYYSVIPITIVPYVLGFLLAAYFFWQASNDLPAGFPEKIKTALRLCALLLVLITASPDISGHLIDKIHIAFASSLFVFELMIAAYIALKVSRTPLIISLASIQLAAGIICYFSIINMIPLQTEGQIIFQLTFGILLINSVSTFQKKNSVLT